MSITNPAIANPILIKAERIIASTETANPKTRNSKKSNAKPKSIHVTTMSRTLDVLLLVWELWLGFLKRFFWRRFFFTLFFSTGGAMEEVISTEAKTGVWAVNAVLVINEMKKSRNSFIVWNGLKMEPFLFFVTCKLRFLLISKVDVSFYKIEKQEAAYYFYRN
jgi:hypothetical protein